LTKTDLIDAVNDYAQQWATPNQRSLIQTTEQGLESGSLDTELIDQWMSACSAIWRSQSLSGSEQMKIEMLIHLAALLARYHAEASFPSSRDKASLLYLVVLQAEGHSAVATYALERLADHLVQARKFDEVLQLCEPKLTSSDIEPRDRFVFRQLAAQCYLDTNKQAAYQSALGALADWRRILDGLYEETHKVAWIRKGEPCLKCAIAAISQPVDWMTESERRRNLFRLTELGKARLVSDMINRRAYVPNTYLLSSRAFSSSIHDIIRQEPDWFVPLTLQASVYSDSILVEDHDESFATSKVHTLDLEPLRCTVLRPLSAEQRLLTTALSVAYESSDVSPDHQLYEDFKLAYMELPSQEV
jgi:hypothetical protein